MCKLIWITKNIDLLIFLQFDVIKYDLIICKDYLTETLNLMVIINVPHDGAKLRNLSTRQEQHFVENSNSLSLTSFRHIVPNKTFGA